MGHVTYSELVERFGKGRADAMLRIVENWPKRRSNVVAFDKNERFRHALHALNETQLALR